MKHYEIVLLVHPDQSDQVPSMVDRYKELIATHNGQMHRFEDWGRRQLAYPIKKVHKAHYLLFNVEIPGPALTELENLFRFSDAVLRSLIVICDAAQTEPAPMSRNKEEDQGSRRGRRSPSDGDGDDRRGRGRGGDRDDASGGDDRRARRARDDESDDAESFDTTDESATAD